MRSMGRRYDMNTTTFSEYPQIQRLQGCILYPAFIEEQTVAGPDGEESTQYTCTLLRVADHGQQIDDRTQFDAEHYAELRRLAIEDAWPQHLQNEARDESDLEDRPEKLAEFAGFKEMVKATWPKP